MIAIFEKIPLIYKHLCIDFMIYASTGCLTRRFRILGAISVAFRNTLRIYGWYELVDEEDMHFGSIHLYCCFIVFFSFSSSGSTSLHSFALFPLTLHTVWRNFLRALGLLFSRINEGGKWGEEIQKVWAPWGGKCSSLPSFSPLPFLSSSHLISLLFPPSLKAFLLLLIDMRMRCA